MRNSFIFGGNTGETYESLQEKRRQAQRLQSRNRAPRNVGEGLFAVGQALQARRLNNQATRGLQAGQEQANTAFSGLFGGGSPQPQATAPRQSQGGLRGLFAPQDQGQPTQPAGPTPTQEGGGDLIQTASLQPPQSPQSAQPSRGDAGTSPFTPFQGDASSIVRLTNSGATRNQPITDNLQGNLATAVSNVYGPGYRVEVFSGGQPHKGSGGARVGSVRHDGGSAADVRVIGPDGKQIKGDALAPLAQFWRAANFGGVGLEMHGGGIHLDEHVKPPPGGAAFWNYANKGGSFTDAQRAAIDAGQGGSFPQLFGGGQPAPPQQQPQQAGAPQQFAQAQPQGQTGNDARLQQLIQLSGSGFLNQGQRQVIAQEISRLRDVNDPLKQTQLQNAQIGLQRNQLELERARNPDRKTIKGADGFQYFQDTGKRVLPNIAEARSLNGDPKFGLNPIFGTDPDGNTVIGQLTSDGRLRRSQTSDGFVPSSPFDKARNAASGRAIGGAEGAALGASQGDVSAADTALDVLDQIESSDGIDRGTGFSSFGNAIPGTVGKDFQNLVDQAKSTAFTTAIQQLRGLGALSNAEGAAATAAIARLDTATSKEAFLKALSDYRNIVKRGKARALSRGASLPDDSVLQTQPTAPEAGGSLDFGNMSMQELQEVPTQDLTPEQLEQASQRFQQLTGQR